MTHEVHESLKRLPLFKDIPADRIRFERLCGFTNRNYRITSPAGDHFLRIVGDGEAATLDRRIEEHNLRIVEKAGLTPEVLYYDQQDGLMLTRYLTGARMLTGPILKSDPDALARAGRSFRRLHGCSPQFLGSFEVSRQIEGCVATLRRLDVAPPPGFLEVYDATKEIREKLAKIDWPYVPCHIDPLAENFLDTGEMVYIVDFEYSAAYDPMWDLGDFAIEAELDPEQEHHLLRAYFDDEPPRLEWARVVMYEVLSDLYWSLVGMVHFANKNPVEDWWAYSTNRLARGKRIMGEERFKEHVETLQVLP